MMAFVPNLLYVTGVFACALGVLHFFFPLLFDFRGALSLEGPPLKPFPLLFTRYDTTRQDIAGLVWVMNHAASFMILTAGMLDLFWRVWLNEPYSALVALWVALFYFVRAGSQLYMGRRRGDWMVLTAFAALGIMHVIVIIR